MKKLEQPLISIIVPVYKVEKYLKRCVDTSIMRHTAGMCVSTRAAYSLPVGMCRQSRRVSRSIITDRRTSRRNTGYLPIPKRSSLSTPFSPHSNGFKRLHPLRKRTRRGLPMKNGKTSGQHGPKHEGGAYHQLLPYQ